jgi:hypothetical protein
MDWIGVRKWEAAHPVERCRRRRSAADVPGLVRRIRANHEKIRAGFDFAVPGSSWEDGYISGLDGNCVAALSTQHDPGVAGCEAEDFVGGRVVVMEIVDAIPPLGGASHSAQKPVRVRLRRRYSPGRHSDTEEPAAFRCSEPSRCARDEAALAGWRRAWTRRKTTAPVASPGRRVRRKMCVCSSCADKRPFSCVKSAFLRSNRRILCRFC